MVSNIWMMYRCIYIYIFMYLIILQYILYSLRIIPKDGLVARGPSAVPWPSVWQCWGSAGGVK